MSRGVAWRRIPVVLAALALMIARASSAGVMQSADASVAGVVRDASSAPLVGALVSLKNLESGLLRETRSTAEGRFEFLALAPARYELTVTLDGFDAVEHLVDVSLDVRHVLRVVLPPARRREAVDVRPVLDLPVDPTRVALGYTLTGRELRDLPVLAGLTPNLMALATLAPGVVPDVTGVSGIATAAQTGNDNTFLLDGLSVDSAISGGQVANLPLEVIREFRVVSNQFSAEFGQASGVVIDLVTRSGTNEPSLRLYSRHQNGDWNATSATTRDVGGTDPDLRQFTAGAAGGGPIVRDRMFVFAGAEQAVQRTEYTNTSTATSAFRRGDPLVLPIDTRAPKVFARVDSNLPGTHTVTARYFANRSRASDSQREDFSVAERGRRTVGVGADLALVDIKAFGHTAVNEFRAQRGRSRTTTSVDSFCPECVTLNYPNLILLGKPANAPQELIGRRTELADVVTLAHRGRAGAHTMRAGFTANLLVQSGTTPVNAEGTYVFQTNLPFDAANPGTYPTRFTQSLGDPAFQVDETITSTFAEDEWQPGGGLTVRAGLRWDRVSWPGLPATLDDVAPRFGVAFAPGTSGRTVFRTGAGRFYNELFLPVARDGALGLVQITIQRPGYEGDLQHADPYGPNPNRTGPAVAQAAVNRLTTLSTPYTDQVSGGWERALGSDVGLSIDGVYARGHNLLGSWDLNYPAGQARIRPDSSYQAILTTASMGQSWYRDLRVGLRKRYARGSAFSAVYLWSSAENLSDGRGTFVVDQNALEAERGPTLNDARHRFSGSGTVALPWRLRLSAVAAARSGLPYNITTGGDDNRDGVFNDRPAGVSRNAGRGAASFTADVRISADVRVGGQTLEIVVDAFNVTNSDRWERYQGNLAQPSTFGHAAASGSPRQLQIGLRLDIGRGRR